MSNPYHQHPICPAYLVSIKISIEKKRRFDVNINPRPPEPFSAIPPPKGVIVTPPEFSNKRLIQLYLLPLYSYESFLSIDTKKVPPVYA